MGVANGAYRCGPVLLSRTHRASHSLSGHRALSGHTAHGRTPRAACILCRASDCTRSQALTRRKDGFGPRLTAIARVSFFLVIVQHGSGFVRTDILNQALPIKKKTCAALFIVLVQPQRLFIVQITMLYYIHSCCWNQNKKKAPAIIRGKTT